jgi:hypothetical protein
MLSHVLAVLVLLVAQSIAGFTNAFDSITSGSSVALTWDAVEPQHYPLRITAQVIDKNGDGFSANAYRVNITSTPPLLTWLTWLSFAEPDRTPACRGSEILSHRGTSPIEGGIH